MEKIEPIKLEEQDAGNVHIFRHSVIPLILRLFIINVLWFSIYFLFSLLVFKFLKDAYSQIALWINILFFFLLQLVFNGLSLFIALNWLSEVYIINYPVLMTRRGILNVKEERRTVSVIVNVEVQQGMLGKIFNYGTIHLDDIEIADIPDPYHIVEAAKQKSEKEDIS